MSFLSKLFGGGGGSSAPTAHTEEHKGFTITPAAEKTEGGYRIGALIEKDGRTHTLIRADIISSKDAADQASVAKAKLVIDQQGDTLFG